MFTNDQQNIAIWEKRKTCLKKKCLFYHLKRLHEV